MGILKRGAESCNSYKRVLEMADNAANGHGGSRRGAGRKKHYPPLKLRCVNLTDDQVKLLRLWGHGDVCAGLRWLIDMGAILVHRVEPDRPHSSG